MTMDSAPHLGWTQLALKEQTQKLGAPYTASDPTRTHVSCKALNNKKFAYKALIMRNILQNILLFSAL